MGKKRTEGRRDSRQPVSARGKAATLLPFMCSPTDSPLVPEVCGAYLVENHPFKMDTLLYIGSERDMRRYLMRGMRSSLDGVEVDFSSIDGVTIPCRRQDGSQFVLVYMPRFNWSSAHFAVLAHEIVHSSVFILKMSGVHNSILEGDEASDSDDECLAHLVDSQMESLVSKLVRKGVRSLGIDLGK